MEGVSKDSHKRSWPCFETRPSDAPQHEVGDYLPT
jgi:hypothetical protein